MTEQYDNLDLDGIESLAKAAEGEYSWTTIVHLYSESLRKAAPELIRRARRLETFEKHFDEYRRAAEEYMVCMRQILYAGKTEVEPTERMSDTSLLDAMIEGEWMVVCGEDGGGVTRYGVLDEDGVYLGVGSNAREAIEQAARAEVEGRTGKPMSDERRNAEQGAQPKAWEIVPNGWPIRLCDCPPGLFEFNGNFHLKTEYGLTEVYVCDSGEVFWGGTDTPEERAKLIVVPARIEAIYE